MAVAAPPSAAVAYEAVKVGMPEGRPTIATADSRLSLANGGLMQFDMGGYFQNPNPNTQFPKLNDGVNSGVVGFILSASSMILRSTSHPISAAHRTGRRRCLRLTSTTPGSGG